jgi:hypothetical protein
MKKFFQYNKTLIKFFEWLYFSDKEFKIVKIKGINVFLCDKKYGSGRWTISPVWDRKRIKSLIRRFLNVFSNKNISSTNGSSFE